MSPKPSGQSSRKTPATSLAAFMRDKVRAGCVICQLPAEVRAQLGRPATKRGYSREDQVEWLRTAVGVNATLEALAVHLNGKHDQGTSDDAQT